MPPAESFGPVAPYYDELMKAVPYPMWVGYYLLLLSQQNIIPTRILDVCCGTGTLCEMLTDEGFELSGFDLSAPMIEAARQKATQRGYKIRYEVADASQVDLRERFDAAFSFFDSLNNITDPDRLQASFHRISDHLGEGGSFVFDLNTAYAFEQKLFDQQILKPSSKLRYKWLGDWNPNTRIISVDMQFWYGNEEFRELHIQRAYEEAEVREMLGNAGFDDIRTYNSYTLSPPRKNSDRIHFAAVKAR